MEIKRRTAGKVVRDVELFTSDGVRLKVGGAVYLAVRSERDGHESPAWKVRCGKVAQLGPCASVALIRFSDGSEYSWTPRIEYPYRKCPAIYGQYGNAECEADRENRAKLATLRQYEKDAAADVRKFKKAAGLR